jgi:hypothetical protein
MACRPVEHPRRNFQPTVCLRLFQRAAEDDLVSLVDGTMNANSATKPSMMPIKNLAKNGPVGVLKPCCITASERIERACASSHPWSRELQAVGHTVRLMRLAYVKPYVKRQKNDAANAEAICEAVTRATSGSCRRRRLSSRAA